MIIASAVNDGERRMLIVGLEEENVRRLRNDEPLQKDLGEFIPELAGWQLSVLGPEDTARFLAQVRAS